MCFLPSCCYHIFLLGNVEELLQKLDCWCFIYQHVDCLYTLIKYRFREINVVESVQVFDNGKMQSILIKNTEELIESPASRKRDSRGKSIESIYLAPSKRQNQGKPVDQSLQKKLNKFQGQKLDLDY